MCIVNHCWRWSHNLGRFSHYHGIKFDYRRWWMSTVFSIASKDALQERIPILMLMFIFCMSTSPGFSHCCLDMCFLPFQEEGPVLPPCCQSSHSNSLLGYSNSPQSSYTGCHHSSSSETEAWATITSRSHPPPAAVARIASWLLTRNWPGSGHREQSSLTDNASPFDSLTPRTKSGQWRSHHAQHASYYYHYMNLLADIAAKRTAGSW